ncbi:MAG: AI-2E family transporter [Bacteroidaceae bacterium]|nr:AI-2E family transporter [Bacteroidaceae bacterium]
MHKPITLQRVIHFTTIAVVVIAVIALLNYLSNVLMPFFVAWALAYLIYPLVKFVQYKMKVKNRSLAIIISLIFIIIVVGGFIGLFSGQMISQLKQLGGYIDNFVKMHTESDSVTMYIKEWLDENREEIGRFVKEQDVAGTLKSALPQLWLVISKTYNIIIGFGVVLMAMLYMFFILLDYEYLTTNWIKIFPKSVRPFWQNVATDVEKAMNSYIRGQSLVALTMGILFCIGFTIIDFPMAIGLGILIGIMDLVPYLHTFALIPTAFLALMKAADTGQNFFVVFGLAVLVFCVVQVIIDMVVTPKIMGKAMGMNPAVLLLSLSVWGSLLGFIGLIIALPLTTILMAYYKRYVTRDEEDIMEEEQNK